MEDARSNRIVKPPRGAPAICKTCKSCRLKKVKCTGIRPKCRHCEVNDVECIYPRDYRKDTRPSKGRIHDLESKLERMLNHMKTSGIVLPEEGTVLESVEKSAEECVSVSQASPSVNGPPINSLPTPSISSASPVEVVHPPGLGGARSQESATPLSADAINRLYATEPANQVQTRGMSLFDTPPGSQQNVDILHWQDTRPTDPVSGDNGGGATMGLSLCEARVAGVFHDRGYVSSVHGLAGVMNPNLRALHKKNISNMKCGITTEESVARLISNAALQKQLEGRLFRQPQNRLDLDGCAPDLAKHLLDLHFNRQHYDYVLTYRPAFMDNLTNGGGPWANKLLLNAIYFSSASYSDLPASPQGSDGTEGVGSRFYRRFKSLLVDEYDRPSTATAAALLLVGGTLISRGRSSPGWTLSGTAYRMIMDLGCHMIIGSDYSGPQNAGQLLQLDLEQEMRKRLYWGAYVADASQALYLGRPCMFASVDARVPLQFLDTFEELEAWEPMSKHSATATGSQAYDVQPGFAVSTFMSIVRLMQISTKITDLYGIQSIKKNSDTLLEKYHSIEWELEKWRSSLPSHLDLHPDSTFVPPPHQITPHTTYHALIILLHRAYLEEGHLRRHSSDTDKKRGQSACMTSALAIEKYLRMYRDSFSLHRAPFLLSYAVYSAVTVVLQQEEDDRRQSTATISFFWECLQELHRGSDFGLQKPLRILQEVVRELQIDVSLMDSPAAVPQLQARLEYSPYGETSGNATDAGPGQKNNSSVGNANANEFSIINRSDPVYGLGSSASLDFLSQQEFDISRDPLYGLFGPTHAYR